MTKAECTTFLRWALPRLELRWTGFRDFRPQVCKRVQRRIGELGLGGVDAYRARLEEDEAEWEVLAARCVVTISRFYRDGAVWRALRDEVLPALAEQALAAKDTELACWSVGCASGEEPYTLSVVWALEVSARYPGLSLRILATDVDEHVLARARTGKYEPATLRELPRALRNEAFEERDGLLRLKERFREPVELRRHDVRSELPAERFRLVLCRNVVFTYFDEALQARTLTRMVTRMEEGGALVIAPNERLPPESPLPPWHPELGLYRSARFTTSAC